MFVCQRVDPLYMHMHVCGQVLFPRAMSWLIGYSNLISTRVRVCMAYYPPITAGHTTTLSSCDFSSHIMVQDDHEESKQL